jgi:hypothetical protein
MQGDENSFRALDRFIRSDEIATDYNATSSAAFTVMACRPALKPSNKALW